MKRISDSSIRLVFTPSPECRRNHGAVTHRMPPSDLIEIDCPCCLECGERYDYSYAEIKERSVTIHVRGGVAYAPEKSFNGVKVKVRDHDNH